MFGRTEAKNKTCNIIVLFLFYFCVFRSYLIIDNASWFISEQHLVKRHHSLNNKVSEEIVEIWEVTIFSSFNFTSNPESGMLIFCLNSSFPFFHDFQNTQSEDFDFPAIIQAGWTCLKPVLVFRSKANCLFHFVLAKGALLLEAHEFFSKACVGQAGIRCAFQSSCT